MERVKSLNTYQKAICLISIVMVIVFVPFYSATINRVGFSYQDEIMIPEEQDGTITYTGKINGQASSFIISPDQSVVFQYGENTYGPYIVKRDPSAVPQTHEDASSMTGIEVCEGEELLFRGGIHDFGDKFYLYNEEGEMQYIFVPVTEEDFWRGNHAEGIENDPMEPSVPTILKLLRNPELTHKGEWSFWFEGLLICVVTICSILFVDDLFRWNLSLQIRNADRAEPSEFEIAGRYIGWTILPIAELIILIVGLM